MPHYITKSFATISSKQNQQPKAVHTVRPAIIKSNKNAYNCQKLKELEISTKTYPKESVFSTSTS